MSVTKQQCCSEDVQTT